MSETKKIKPFLTSKEKRRYSTASEHFMRGASTFMIQYHQEIGKLVDLDSMQAGAMKTYKEILDQYKENLAKKVEKMKRDVENSLIGFLDNVLVGAVVAYGFVKYFDIDVKKGFQAIEQFLEIANTLKHKTEGSLESLSEFVTGNKEAFRDKIEESIVDLPLFIVKVATFVTDGIDSFLNSSPTGEIYGNVFFEMLKETAVFAFNRALDSSIGSVLGLFLEKLHSDVIKRPNLVNFLKYGPAAFNQIRSAEELGRKLGQISSEGQSATHWDASGWVYTYKASGGKNGAVNWYQVDSGDGDINKRGWVRTMNEIHCSYVAVADEIAKNTNLDNPFSNIISPYTTASYNTAHTELMKKLKIKFDLDGHIAHGELEYFFFKGNEYDEVKKTINELVPHFQNEANPDIKMVLFQWEEIQKRIQRNIVDYPRTSGINVEMANEMMLILMTLTMYRKQQLINNYTNLEIENHNFLQDSKAARTLEVLKETKGRQVDFVQTDVINGFITSKNIKQYYDEFFAQVDEDLKEQVQEVDVPQYWWRGKDLNFTRPKRGRMFSGLMMNDLMDGKMSIQHVVNRIKSIQQELIRMAYKQQGYDDSYFFNNYSTGSDDVRMIQQSTGNARDEREMVVVGQDGIQSQMANVELATRLVQEFCDFKYYINEHRERRYRLVTYIIEGLKRIHEIKQEYVEVK